MENSVKKELTLEQICELMPKVELHAHLNGSISESILHKLEQTPNCNNVDHNKGDLDELFSKRRENNGEPKVVEGNGTICLDVQAQEPALGLSGCWIAFRRIHEIIRTPEILFQATCQVIENFSLDNVIYLEIRTTPKQVHDIPSKKVYIETLVRAIKFCKEDKKLPIIVKLLISIDRGNSARHYLENVCLTQWYKMQFPDIVVGMDLSGDPRKGDINKIMFAVNFARKINLRFSVHLPEVVNPKECKALLENSYHPDRVAHGQFVHPSTGGSKELWEMLKNNGTCMEACITSNIVTGISPLLEDHYVQLLHEDDIPFTICTDDSGVFKTTLSNEYKKFLQLIPLSKEALKSLCVRSASFIFGTNEEKAVLSQQIEKWWKDNLSI